MNARLKMLNAGEQRLRDIPWADLGNSFDLLATAPDGVALLRGLILKLAVTGRLVPQRSDDEPAEVQLRRILARKAARLSVRRTGKERPIDSNEESLVISDLPLGWSLARLNELVTVINGRAYRKQELLASGTPVLRVGNLFTSKDWYYSDLALEPEKYCDKGDLIFSWSASFGPFIWQGPRVIYHYHIWKLDLHSTDDLSKDYLHTFLMEKTQELKTAGHGVSMIHMTKESMERVVVPLPPLAEQHRIVARVKELMALCDSLEKKGQLEAEQHARLVSVLFDSLVASESPQALAENWQRVARHFDLFLDRPEAIDELEKCILQFAMRGLLVEQDSHDEPAKELLGRIARQKETMRAGRKARQGKVSRPKSAPDAPSDLPKTWKWTNVDSLCFKVTDGTHFTPRYVDKGIRFVSAKDIVGGVLVFDRCRFISQEEHEQLYKRCNPEYHDIVISKSGSIGTVALVVDRNEFSLFESLALLKCDKKNLCPEFLVLALTHACASLTTSHIRGVGVKHLHLDIMRGLELGLPPLAEQKRIVARVKELRQLCGDLKERLSEAQCTQGQLANAVVSRCA